MSQLYSRNDWSLSWMDISPYKLSETYIRSINNNQVFVHCVQSHTSLSWEIVLLWVYSKSHFVCKSHSACRNHTRACLNHTRACENHTLRAEITLVRVEITLTVLKNWANLSKNIIKNQHARVLILHANVSFSHEFFVHVIYYCVNIICVLRL
jgi:hypothetical protein